jgi:hypothetical protein
MVAMTLLSLIVLALMAVFTSTQRAFRAGLTQTDTLETGRAVMNMITDDLGGMTPSFGSGNATNSFYTPVNFSVDFTNYVSPPSPLIQPLVGSSQQRTNVLEKIFILSRNNQTWTGTGYIVGNNLPDGTLYPLYRFSMTTNAGTGDAGRSGLYNNFTGIPLSNSNVWSHLMDGVVDLRVRAYDTNGIWMTNGYSFGQSNTLKNTRFIPSPWGEVGYYMYSNSLPASVEIELGTIEDRTLQHAESLVDLAPTYSQSNYLAGAAGKVHIFRQRVWIRNMDTSAY